MFDYDNDVSSTEKQDHETEKQPPTPVRRKSHSIEPPQNVFGVNNIHKDGIDGDIKMQQHSSTSAASIASDDDISQPIRKTSFATLPNTTTWQQQSVNYQKVELPRKFILRYPFN